MKRLSLLLAILFAGAGNLAAQMHGVEITYAAATVSGGALNVAMVIDAEKIEVDCNGSYRLIPYIENGGVRLRLPEVVYAGSQRYKFDRRRENLSGALQSEPYKVFPKANRRKPETVQYSVTVPYSAWMDDAVVTYEWTVNDCRGEAVLMAGCFPEVVDAIDHRRQAYPSVYTDVVFYTPEQESYRAQGDVPVAGKRRHISADLYVNFPQNVPDIRLDFRSNFDELRKADSLMNYIMSNDNVSEVEVSVHGYASPEGALWRNRNLARYRALNVKKYLDGRFDLSSLPLRVEWTPVDWAGLREILSTGDFPLADEIVAIIDGTEGDQERERIISSVLGRDLHRRLVAEVYPRLRRTVVRADFTVPPFTPEESRELIDSEPELMSLEEMYSAAGLYEEGSYEHTEIYLRAARQFPDDFIANNNAAAALLRSGNSREAYKYLIKISSDPRAYSNTGIYYYLEGDIEKAKEYFRMAMDAGTPGAEKRLKMIEGNSDR